MLPTQMQCTTVRFACVASAACKAACSSDRTGSREERNSFQRRWYCPLPWHKQCSTCLFQSENEINVKKPQTNTQKHTQTYKHTHTKIANLAKYSDANTAKFSVQEIWRLENVPLLPRLYTVPVILSATARRALGASSTWEGWGGGKKWGRRGAMNHSVCTHMRVCVRYFLK